MGVRKRTTEEFKQQIYEKYNGKVEIIGEYLGGSIPIEFIYHCENHGDVLMSMHAKNISSNKTFQPCEKCMSENKSNSNGVGRNKEELYNEFKAKVESKGGKLKEDSWMKSKFMYTIKCNDDSHPEFKMNHDSIMNKDAWCPYCYGRYGNFNSEIKQIVESKNGELLSNYTNSYEHVKVKCLEHDHIWDIMPLNLKKGRWCYICAMPFSEKVVWDFLKDNEYEFETQFYFDDLIGDNNEKLKFDFAIKSGGELKYLLEIDDSEHTNKVYGTNKRAQQRINAQNRDVQKNEYCKLNGVKLFRINYNSNSKKFKDREFYCNYITDEFNKINNILGGN